MLIKTKSTARSVAEPTEGSLDLPPGWRWEKLGDVLPLAYGKALRESLRDESGEVVVYGSSGPVGRHSAALTGGPTILVGRKGAAGAIHYSQQPCWPIDTVYYVLPRNDTDLRYGFFLLKHLQLNRLDQSTAIPSLGRDVYSDLWVPVPPRETQRRIVARIDELFAEIDDGERALAEAHAGLDTYRKSLLNAAVTGQLTADWRSTHPSSETNDYLRLCILQKRRKQWTKIREGGQRKYAEPLPANFDALPEIPNTWTWLSVDELSSPLPGSISDGPFGSNLKGEHYRDIGPRVIRLGNVGKEGEFVDLKAHIEQEHFEALGRHHVAPNDIVVAILGEPLPRAVIVPDNLGPALVKADCIKVNLLNKAHVPLVWAWINSPAAHHLASSWIKGIGRPRLNMAHIRSLPVPVPPPEEAALLDERISVSLRAGEAMRSEVLDQHPRLVGLRQSILSAAFRGELAP